MLMKAVLAIVVILIGLYGFGFTQRAEVRTEIVIDAPPDAVWSVMTDFAVFAEWSVYV